jgi:hypothetical protein
VNGQKIQTASQKRGLRWVRFAKTPHEKRRKKPLSSDDPSGCQRARTAEAKSLPSHLYGGLAHRRAEFLESRVSESGMREKNLDLQNSRCAAVRAEAEPAPGREYRMSERARCIAQVARLAQAHGSSAGW